MKLNDQALLWNQAFIKIIDVRHTIMEQEEELHAYRLPSSAFIYVTRGSAQLQLDGIAHHVSQFSLIHGGKGFYLDITAEELLDYYMIMYKAVLALPARKETVKLIEQHNPFQMQYMFKPHYPISIFHHVTSMSKEWHRSNLIEKLQVKAIFYQMVHEILEQMERQNVIAVKPDLVAQAVRYIHERYREPITLESLLEHLDCSSRQLLRAFKKQVRTSPIDYLIQLRMSKAKHLLLSTDFTLKEIAESVGYTDSYYFSRIFKKYEGASPTSFKEAAMQQEQCRNNPSVMFRSPIVARRQQRYIGNEFENRYHYKREGVLPMYRKSRTAMAATLLFCFTLLLSACTTGGTNATSANSSSPSSNVAASTSPAASPASDTRVIKHAMGEETLTGTPERIVILTNEGTEALLAVGIKPVGAVQSWIGDPWYDHIKQEMEGVTVVGDELQPNIEMIASLKPDLIIGNKVRQEKIYDQLKQIAPTIFSDDLAGDWKINFKLYSEALNKQKEGEQVMEAFDKRVADVKAKLGSKAETKVSVVRFSAKQVRIYQKQTFSGVLLSQLGIARPASQDKDSFIEVMSKETIPSMDGDVLFYFVSESPGKNDAAKVVEEWKKDPLFQNLSVSKNNKIIQVDEAIWNSAGGYEAANLLLDELVKYFDVK
ncbi:AraC family transcriptional regulator [Paenibacillus sp. UMB4589-SE434]|uniref:AraC family transcriptional regulator n=1 Tax=Paenibacillus sp. UMB4589-SE434 TaxID=3046314 RepID=UPI00254B52C6|nr:AraC family transcriptional regulator [Paenibacillus sp. UMB4589-SE434]MDK8180113.1 AraC family transcriptional regulator [Paenibacillus sp. UMB4589-SE434]